MDSTHSSSHRSALPVAVCAVLASACSAPANSALPDPAPTPDGPVPYKTFKGADRELYPWIGEHVALLTRTADYDAATVEHLLSALDHVYEFIREGTGREPVLFLQHEGRIPIAVEADTCGTGCGMLGATGIELMPDRFEELYDFMHASNQLELTPAYELGRNFWFHSEALEYHGDDLTGTVAAGWARLIGLWSIDASGWKLAPHQGGTGAEYLAEVRGLVDLYERDPTATWSNTLREGQSVTNRLDLGASNLFVSFILRVEELSERSDFRQRFLRALGDLPSATTTIEAVDNLVLAASRAAGKDLCPLFRERWRFPVSSEADGRVREALSNAD